MRLSETQHARLRPSRGNPHGRARRDDGRPPRALWRRVGAPLGALAVLAAAGAAAVGPGHSLLTTHAAQGQQGQQNPEALAAQRQNATERPHAGTGQLNLNCTLVVPANPLSAQGLATPYQLVATNQGDGPCHESNPDQMAFVQGAVLDPATGAISVYNPLVVDQGTQPAAQPVVPTLPAKAVVALWFGFNGDMLRLSSAPGTTLQSASCVNGLGASLFGQFAYCNAPAFFSAANGLIKAGTLTPPALGTATDGMTCPTVRDFAVVDQDQSDNVTTTYLVTANGQIAQNTAANKAALATQQVSTRANGSDNRLLAVALDGALGCTPWQAPDLADAGHLVPALPLNELQAAMFQQAPVATVPSADPMTLVQGNANVVKQNLYRAGVDQSAVASPQQATGDMQSYCRSLLQVAPARIQRDMQLTLSRPSPTPSAANNLFTFMAQRFDFTWGSMGLNCSGLINQPSPITVQTDSGGVAVSATVNLPPAGA